MPDSQVSKNRFITLTEDVKKFFREKSSKVSVDVLNWIAVLCLHSSTIPSLLALMTGLTDSPPPVDVVLMVWTGLILLFIKSAIQRDTLILMTIGLGFVIQSVMMMLLFFK